MNITDDALSTFYIISVSVLFGLLPVGHSYYSKLEKILQYTMTYARKKIQFQMRIRVVSKTKLNVFWKKFSSLQVSFGDPPLNRKKSKKSLS